jgi:beta-1,4-mannosyltransferase
MQTPNSVLLIAGEGTPELQRKLECAAGCDPRVRLQLGHIPADHVQFYFRAADLVALPYRNILNSGAALLALSFSRPVLVPALGAMNELAASIGAEWVNTYPGDLTPRRLGDALVWALGAQRAAEPVLDDLQWDLISRRTLAAFEQIVSRRRLVAQTGKGFEIASASAKPERVWEI